MIFFFQIIAVLFLTHTMSQLVKPLPAASRITIQFLFAITLGLSLAFFTSIRSPAHAGNQMIRCKPNTYPVWGCAFFGLPLMPIKQYSKEGIIYKIDSDYPYPYTLINRIDREINSKDLGIKYVFDGFFDDDVGVNPGFIPVIYNPEE